MLFAILAAIVGLYFLGALSHLVPTATIKASLESAAAAGQINPWSNVDNDMFTECAIMDMAAHRDTNFLRDLVSTAFSLSAGGHPCEVLRKHLAGAPMGTEPPVIKYHYGARYFFALLSSVMDVAAIRQWLFVLSIVAPLVLAGAIIAAGKPRALALLPLPLLMVLGFSIGTLGNNIAHAPGFVIPTLMLAAIVALHRWLEPRSRRFAAYAILAVVVTYFDTLSGPLPFFLFASIIVNHVLFVASDDGHAWWTEALWVGAVVALAVATALGIRFTAAAVVLGTNPLPEFFRTLAIRLSSDVDGIHRITPSMVIDRVMADRGVQFSGAYQVAVLFYVCAAITWSIAIWETVVHRRPWRTVAAIGGASLVIVVWFLLFPNHTYVHQFMGRLAVAPALAGFIALATLRTKAAIVLPASVLSAIALLMVLHHGLWTLRIGGAIELRPATPVDVVACSNELPLVPDGKADRVFAIDISGPWWTPAHATAISLHRQAPPGTSSTRPGMYGLAVLSSVNGSILSDRETRAIDVFSQGRNQFLLAICDDGADTASSTFSAEIGMADGDSVTVAARALPMP